MASMPMASMPSRRGWIWWGWRRSSGSAWQGSRALRNPSQACGSFFCAQCPTPPPAPPAPPEPPPKAVGGRGGGRRPVRRWGRITSEHADERAVGSAVYHPHLRTGRRPPPRPPSVPTGRAHRLSPWRRAQGRGRAPLAPRAAVGAAALGPRAPFPRAWDGGWNRCRIARSANCGVRATPY